MQNADTDADRTAPRLNRRSCLSCYERKIKCDRREPCLNCSRSNERCDYPRSRIRRNRPRRQDPSDTALADRATNGRRRPGRDECADIIFVKVAPVVIKENGYLVADHSGKSRFLASDAWANVKTEESNLTDVLLGDGDRASTVSGPSHMYLFPLGSSTSATQAWTPENRAYRRPWVPTPIELETCWHIFLENVDPVVRILHKPTIRNLLDEAQQQGLEGLPKPSIALLLAICFCAMVTLDPWRSRALFNTDGNEAMQHCKHAVEHAMAEAQLIQTHDIQVLQAFTLFLTCVQRKNSQPVWTLIGLAIRIATSLGLHQESVNFGLSPFEVEMRRRLWWQLHLLDMRASEDCSYGGVTSIFYESNTRLPLNINDSDLDPGAIAPPTERGGLTEMSFSLLRYDVCSATMRMRKLHYPDAPSDDAVEEGLSSSASSFKKKEAMIEELYSYIHQRYLQYFASNSQSPLCVLAAETGKLVITKTRLVAHHKLLQQLAGPGSRDSSPDHMDARIQVPDFFPDSFLEDLFTSSVSLLESQVRLSSDSQFAQWRWLLGFYNQWHATSFVLSQLCIRLDALRNTTTTCSPSILEKLGRAWRAVEATFAMYQKQDDAYDPNGSSRSARWGPLEFLRQKVEQKLSMAGFDGLWSPSSETLNAYSMSTMSPMEGTGDDLGYNACSADVFNTLGLFTLDL